MSRLDELIAELCPDGVEYKEFQTILKIKNGRDYKSFGEGSISVYGSGGIMAYVDTFVYDKPTVLIPRKGSIDKLYYVDEPFWNVDTIFYTEINAELALPRYVYHCLLREHLEKLNTAGGVPSLTQKVLNKVMIPVPPLEVQREIVRILDNFTELTARKQQYEYFTEKLLSFDDDIEWAKIGDIATVSDYVANGSFASLKENVQYKHNPDYAVLIRTVDYSAGFNPEKFIYIDKHAYDFFAKSRLCGGEIIINNIGAGVGTTFRCPNLGMPMSLAPNAIMVNTPRIISFVSKISALYTKLIFLFTTKYFSMKLDFLMLQ